MQRISTAEGRYKEAGEGRTTEAGRAHRGLLLPPSCAPAMIITLRTLLEQGVRNRAARLCCCGCRCCWDAYPYRWGARRFSAGPRRFCAGTRMNNTQPGLSGGCREFKKKTKQTTQQQVNIIYLMALGHACPVFIQLNSKRCDFGSSAHQNGHFSLFLHREDAQEYRKS